MCTCTFIGQHDCPASIKTVLQDRIIDLIVKENVKVFYVGTHGNFDYYTYHVLCELEKIYSINVFVVLAYINEKRSDVYYKEANIIFPEILEKTPFRYAISKRNHYMIQQSQYMICYMNHTFSNTYQYVKKAKNKALKIINVGSVDLGTI